MMSEVGPAGVGHLGRVAEVKASAGREFSAPENAVRRGSDEVEVSVLATYLSKLKQLPPIRQDLVESIREQIAQGTYDTPEKFDAALDELLRDL